MDALEVSRVERTVSCEGHPVTLTVKEFALLEYLLLNRGRAVSRATLLEQVWKMQPADNTNVVDVYVNYLRRKLHERGKRAADSNRARQRICNRPARLNNRGERKDSN